MVVEVEHVTGSRVELEGNAVGMSATLEDARCQLASLWPLASLQTRW
jgi:hypothetical protein